MCSAASERFVAQLNVAKSEVICTAVTHVYCLPLDAVCPPREQPCQSPIHVLCLVTINVTHAFSHQFDGVHAPV